MLDKKSPLHEMTLTTKTEFWNDSCSIPDLKYAILYGAVGATTNPVIVGDVLKKDMDSYKDEIKKMINDMPKATEDEIGWLLNESMALSGAKLLENAYEKSQGKNGYISIQTNTKYFRNEEKIIEQALHFNTLTKNIMVKMPVTEAGIIAIEECTYQGITVNATVSFSVPQAIAVGEAIERGLNRREKEGKPMLYPVCTIMIGRVDDWIKNVVADEKLVIDPDALEFAGIAVFKNAYKIYKEKKYRTRLLAAAYRNHHHWSEFIGGDVSLTIPSKFIRMFNTSDIACIPRMDNPVEERKLIQLKKIKDFNRAFEPDGMEPKEFNTFGATRKTLMQFLNGYDEMIGIIRSFMV